MFAQAINKIRLWIPSDGIFHPDTIHSCNHGVVFTNFSNTVTILHFSYTELEHNVTVTASHSDPVSAGSSLTLTCTAVCDRVPRLTWVGPNGAVVTGNGITVSPQTDDGRISTLTLTFNSIRTSHAGYYNCTSEVTEPLSTTWDAYLVRVQSK